MRGSDSWQLLPCLHCQVLHEATALQIREPNLKKAPSTASLGLWELFEPANTVLSPSKFTTLQEACHFPALSQLGSGGGRAWTMVPFATKETQARGGRDTR